jgi:leucyl aminopeptidase
MPPQIAASRGNALEQPCDVLIVAARRRGDEFELSPSGTAADARLEGALSRALNDARFTSRPGDVQIVPTLGQLPARALAVAGTGEDANTSAYRRAAGAAVRKIGSRAQVASTLGEDDAAATAASAEGFLLGSYRFAGYRSGAEEGGIERVVMLNADEAAVREGTIRGEAVVFARDLTNEPAGVLTPTVLVERARIAAEAAGVRCTILEQAALEEAGYGGLLAVAAGSAEPPVLLRLHYRPEGTPRRVALVGKGVTYDSGGLTIKPAASMDGMKTDMGGGAVAIAATIAAARLELPTEIVTYVPCTENMIGPAAMRPGDVIHHYGGRTTEMVNADAEGRLILADALVRAGEDDPESIVDVATLTGHVTVALGKKIGGLFATDDALATDLLAAADLAGESLWRLPLPEEYVADLASDVADAKNSGPRYGGGLTAALFLRAFVRRDVPWAHLDIAGPARAESDSDEGPKGATGFGTRTLITWLRGEAS